MSPANRLTRMRWGVRAVLALGVAASVTANVLHARPNPISQTIAGWPPIALLLTVELISRIPVNGRGLAAVRIVATALIAGIAAWVSYWHMAGVAGRYGETGASAYLLPLSVDGLVVVASVCLVELGGQLATVPVADRPPQTVPDRGPATAANTPGAAHPGPEQTTHPALHPDAPPGPPTLADAEPTAARAPSRGKPAAPAERSPALFAEIQPTSAPQTVKPNAAYQPTSDDDRAMYQAWLGGMSDGQEPSGADLARATGRPDDNTGVGRRAARRYRNAHTATHDGSDPHPSSNDGARPRRHNGHQHNGHKLAGARA